MRDDLLRWRCTPLRLVLGRVGVADKRGVVSSDKRAVEGRANAGVGLCTGDDESSDSQAGQHVFEVGVLEGIAIVLLVLPGFPWVSNADLTARGYSADRTIHNIL